MTLYCGFGKMRVDVLSYIHSPGQPTCFQTWVQTAGMFFPGSGVNLSIHACVLLCMGKTNGETWGCDGLLKVHVQPAMGWKRQGTWLRKQCTRASQRCRWVGEYPQNPEPPWPTQLLRWPAATAGRRVPAISIQDSQPTGLRNLPA
eukprot:364705-Chlamydomonas_euryale.AAC.10